MTPLPISIETLEPMTVAAVVARGSSPEVEAWDRLTVYAEPRGLLDDRWSTHGTASTTGPPLKRRRARLRDVDSRRYGLRPRDRTRS
jgi:hypothetical protein